MFPFYAMLSGRRGLTYDVPRMSFVTRMLTENSRFDQYSEHFERCYLDDLFNKIAKQMQYVSEIDEVLHGIVNEEISLLAYYGDVL